MAMRISTEVISKGKRKSCTARSMAFLRDIWERVDGFPQTTLLGEDTLFDGRIQQIVAPAYAENAMAIYEPGFTYSTALHTIARYSAADGALGVRESRFHKMALRCALQAGAIVALWWTWWPLVVVAVLELYVALERDRSVLLSRHWNSLVPRLALSVSIPWTTVIFYLRGSVTKSPVLNPQNLPTKK